MTIICSFRKRYILAFMLATVLPVLAADDINDKIAQNGEAAMNGGRYDEAIGLFEKILQTGQTYVGIFSVKFDLAWCYYQRGKYDKALPLLTELVSGRAQGKEMVEQSAFLLGECYARLGAAQTGKENEKERKKNLAEAIRLQSDFIKNYPKSQNYPYALYGRAYAYYLSGNLEKAEEDLNSVLGGFGKTPVGMSARFLLGSVYSQQGLEQIKGGRPAEARPYLDKARKIYDQLSKSNANLALANDSNYSLAETWFNAEQYAQAIQYFHNVRPREDVLADLKKRQEALNTERAVAFGKGMDTKVIEKERDGVLGQYAGVRESPDLMITAYFRIAESFFKMKRYDEAIVVCQHLLQKPFVQDKQYTQASFLIINGYIARKNPAAAAQEYDVFKAKAGADAAIAESTALAIGQLYFIQTNIVAALPYFAESVEAFPDGKGLEDALYMKAACESSLGQSTNLQETIEMYMEKFPKGHFMPNLLFFKATNLSGENKWNEAIQTIDELLRQFPQGTDSFESLDDVFYQKGVFLIQLRKPKEAVNWYNDFLKRYPDSRLKPFALYQLSIALNDDGQLGKSVAVLEQIARDYPKMDIAPQSLFRIGSMYYDKNDFVRMSQAFERLPAEFPHSPLNADAFYYLGWAAKEKLNDYDAAVKYLWQALELLPRDRAPVTLFLIAQALTEKAQQMGQPTILPDEQRAVYRQTILESANTYELILKTYPESEEALDAIPGIANAIFNLARFRMMTSDEAAQYFTTAVARYKNNTNLQTQLLFSQGMYLMKNAEKDKAFAVFKQALATDANARLSAQMLLDYADACKDAAALKDAEEIYQRVLANFASDDNAVAPATYGMADIRFLRGQDAEAEQEFSKVLKQFTWFEKAKQGRVKIAQIRERKKDYEAAERMYTEVATQERAPEARGAALLGVIRCQLILADQYEKQGDKARALAKFQAADSNTSKIIIMYDAYPEFISEALWHKGQIYEMQKNYDMARQQYERLVKDYKQYSWAKLAEERLKALPPAAPKAGENK